MLEPVRSNDKGLGNGNVHSRKLFCQGRVLLKLVGHEGQPPGLPSQRPGSDLHEIGIRIKLVRIKINDIALAGAQATGPDAVQKKTLKFHGVTEIVNGIGLEAQGKVNFAPGHEPP